MIKIKLSQARGKLANTDWYTNTLAYQDHHRSPIYMCGDQRPGWDIDISSTLVTPAVGVIELKAIVCIIIPNYSNLSPICLERNCCTVGRDVPRADHPEGGDHSQ